MQPPDTVLRFLWSIGRRSDAEFYLSVFQSEAKERFAAIAVDGPVIRDALDAVVLDLRFLRDLGLAPVVVLGLLDSSESVAHARIMLEELEAAQVPAKVHAPVAGAFDSERVSQALRTSSRDGVIPILPFAPDVQPNVHDRFELLGELLATLETRKLIFLQRRGGLVVGGQLVGIVNLATDYAALAASTDVSSKQKLILSETQRLFDVLHHSCTVAITSPLNLLRELFTTRGAGTLIRRPGVILRLGSFDILDRERLTALLESAFGRVLDRTFLQRPVSRIYLEENYRGAAVVMNTQLGGYMSKFAVERQAQGEGIGKDLWTVLVAEYPKVFWRSRLDNPINPWYVNECEGMVRVPEWQVFWRGLEPGQVAEAVAFVLAQPHDFSSEGGLRIGHS